MVLQSELDPETARAAGRVGRTLRGKWHLDKLLDVGGMAAVYSATHPSGTRGAIKIAHSNASLLPEVVCPFLRHAHPNTVRVLGDDVDDDGNVCVVMELLEGGTLHECAQASGGKLAPDRVLRMVDQMLEGLGALHDSGIVHRDIKPANLFLTTGGQVKILDFGIASTGDASANWAANGCAGLAMGTPEFMSPEQARGRWDLVDAQSDLWSVGATAFTLLSGEHVHNEATLPELLVAVFEQPVRSLATVLPGADLALVEIVDRALQRRRAERWPDARSMQIAVRGAFRAIYGKPLVRGVSSPSLDGVLGPDPALARRRAASEPATRPRPERRRPAAWAVSSALVAASLAGGLAVWTATEHARAAGSAHALAAALAALGEEPIVAAPASMATPASPASPTSRSKSLRLPR